MEVKREVQAAWDSISDNLQKQIISRGYRVSNEMRTIVMLSLRGARSGRIYRVPNTKRYYQASAPGEKPANRTGIYRMSWQPSTYVTPFSENLQVVSKVESNYRVNGRLLGEMLDEGTSRMAPRPHIEEMREKSEEKAMRIYKEPYF